MEGLRVLFVDDEDDFRETIVKRLNARKIQAMGAESGVRALEIVKDNDFDVIVLDVNGVNDARESRRVCARPLRRRPAAPCAWTVPGLFPAPCRPRRERHAR